MMHEIAVSCEETITMLTTECARIRFGLTKVDQRKNQEARGLGKGCISSCTTLWICNSKIVRSRQGSTSTSLACSSNLERKHDVFPHGWYKQEAAGHWLPENHR